MNNALIFFVLGILFSRLIIPILDSLGSIIAQFTECICVDMAVETTKKQLEIEQLQKENQGEEETYAIGFQMPTPIDDDEEEEEDQEGDF